MEKDRALLSGWIRERNIQRREAIICSKFDAVQFFDRGALGIAEILGSYVPQRLDEQLDRVLMSLAAMSPRLGSWLVFDNDKDVAVTFSGSTDEMNFVLETLQEQGLISRGIPPLPNRWQITGLGWRRIEELREHPPETKRAFVAMAFRNDLLTVYEEGISLGITDTGFVPIRVDRREHNEKICDVIIAEIRRSRFLVADFTRHRQGVYFEAGFAMGLGLDVIWCCRKQELTRCHFDTRQYNHIAWTDPLDLRKQLANRIRATIV